MESFSLPWGDGAPPRAPAAPPRSFKAILSDLGYINDFQWAFDNYKPTVLAMSREFGLRRHLEIGGGRDPLFHPDELGEHGISVTLNDISAHELSLAPKGFQTAAHDICALDAPAAIGEGAFDFAYSRMLMEHVRDAPQMWRNIHAMLAPGGLALSFFPTLYAPVFAVNRIMPERLTRGALEAVFPDRKPDGENPKFPAFYDHCYSRESVMLPMLREAGFSEAAVMPFYGYSYFWKFPVLKQIDAAFTRMAKQNDWRGVSSFAYVIARK
jgi:SAM-dependent methyltransferase